MRAAIRFSHTFSVVIANASGMGLPDQTACSLYPTLVRLTPRDQVASRSVVWLGNSSGLPSTRFTSAGAGPPFIRTPTSRWNCSKSARRVRRLIVDWSGSASGRVRGVQFPASHAQQTGRSCSAAQVWTLTTSAVECWSRLCRPKSAATAEIAADNSAQRSSSMNAPSWLKEHHGLELRVAQGVRELAHNPLREREKSAPENIIPHLAPVHTLAGCQILLGVRDALGKRSARQVLDVIREGQETLW